MNKRQFILDALLPYKQDPSICGYDEVREVCEYQINDDGIIKMCAVGKHFKKDIHEEFNLEGDIEGIYEEHEGLENLLTEEALEQNLSIFEWTAIQEYHDNIATKKDIEKINKKAENLERVTKIKFPELYF